MIEMVCAGCRTSLNFLEQYETWIHPVYIWDEIRDPPIEPVDASLVSQVAVPNILRKPIMELKNWECPHCEGNNGNIALQFEYLPHRHIVSVQCQECVYVDMKWFTSDKNYETWNSA